MTESLRRKFFTGIAWNLVQNVATRVLSVVFTIVLARLLTPEDYGLIGMLSIFISISEVFIQSGFSQALIQKSNCTDEDFSTAFYFNTGISIFFYAILFVTAPLIASFYHEPAVWHVWPCLGTVDRGCHYRCNFLYLVLQDHESGKNYQLEMALFYRL